MWSTTHKNFYKLVQLFICCKPHQIIMDTSIINPNTKLVCSLLQRGKFNLVRVRNDVTLFGLKDQLDQINRRLNHRDTRRVDNVVSTSIDRIRWKFLVYSDKTQEWRRCENHVLNIWPVQYQLTNPVRRFHWYDF